MAAIQSPGVSHWPQVVEWGELVINIWHHVISGFVGDIPCWTYASYGMTKVDQPNLVVTLQRRPSEKEEDYSREPLNWFKMVYLWGKQGRTIDPYHTHEAHFEHWLGSKKLETLTYGMPIELPGFGPGVLPMNRLHGIALTNDESQIAKAYGYNRIIGHHGLSHRWFPYPPWIDRDRDDCLTWAQTNESFRKQIFPVTKKIRGASVRQEGTRIILEFPVGSEDAVKAAVPERTEEAVAFDSHLHPNADSGCIWKKGNTQKMYYGGSNRSDCLGLCFLVLCPQQSTDHYNIVEDGSGIFLRDQTWLAIRQDLSNGRDIIVPLKGENGYEPGTFEIEFLRSRYYYPPTSLELVLSGGVVKKWQSQKPGWLKGSPMRLDRIAIADTFHPDPTIKAGIVNFMEEIGEVVSAIVPKKKKGSTPKLLGIAFNLPAKDPEECFELTASPDMDGIDGIKIWDAFKKMHPPAVSQHTSVRMFFGVWE